ncbi:MAG: aldo/keto reductase [Clostridiales bacterium]|nr:aldo/keto reductase [Clostridiales bacterium]
MYYRQFKKLNYEKISTFGMGTMRLPRDENGKVDIDTSVRLIRGAIDAGVNYFDSAVFYSDSLAETLLGKAFADGYRNRTNVATKMPMWTLKSREEAEEIFRGQFEKIGSDRIDFYLLHSIEKGTLPNALNAHLLEMLDEKKKLGQIRYAGFSFHDDMSLFKKAIDLYDWDFCQIYLNAMDSQTLENLAYAQSKGIPVVTMGSLKGGRLVNENMPRDILPYWNEVSPRPVHEQCFRWLYNNENIMVILSGINSFEQLEDNKRIFENAAPGSVPNDEIEAVNKAVAQLKARIKVGCTKCSYCTPCPQGVGIHDIFSMYNSHAMFENNKEFYDTYQSILNRGNGPEKCVECGACETKCPQHIEIIKMLKEAKDYFDKL